MKSWLASLACFLPLGGLDAVPAQLRFHLPIICVSAWLACAALLLLPVSWRFPRLAAGLALAYAWLGVLRLPWRHPWDGESYWIGFFVFPLFAAGLHRFLRHLRSGETAGRVLLAVSAVYFFPVKVVFRALGLDLPPTPVLSPLVLLALLAGTSAVWRGLPAGWKRALAD